VSHSHPEKGQRRRARWARLLLLLPFIAVVWVPSYNRVEPTLSGIPFFYWYQVLWILITGVVVYAVYRIEN
jgi:hypothetical protein